jgi:hypothetical protein
MSYYFFDFEIYGFDFYELTSFTNNDKEYIIENKIKYLYLNSNDNIPELPNTITHLKLGRYFNKPEIEWVDKIKNITHIFFGNHYNHSIEKLPETITHIFLGYEFNQSVDSLPKNLEYIKLGSKFNKSVDLLPINLKYIIFGNTFNSPIDNLPFNLIGIKLYHYFNCPIKNLPSSIRYLHYSLHFSIPIFFPKNLEQLILPDNYNEIVDNLPDTITHLHLGNIFDKKITKLPNCLKYIIFSNNYNNDILCLNSIKHTLQYVELGLNYNLLIHNVFTNILELVVNINYTHHYNYLPKQLKRLSVNLTNNNNIFNIMYLTDLNYLKIDNYSNNVILLNRLPLNLKILLLNSRNAICNIDLPLELEYLKITSNHKKITEFYLIDKIEYYGLFL